LEIADTPNITFGFHHREPLPWAAFSNHSSCVAKGFTAEHPELAQKRSPKSSFVFSVSFVVSNDRVACRVTCLPVDRDGLLKLADLEAAITDQTAVVSLT
jgi:hypothetical protein